jgi:inhibitor of cysteine peptidase
MLRLAVIGLLAALVAGCATLPPPMPREISDAIDGARVTLAPGQDLIVTLESNPTSGFRWSLTRAADPVLTVVGEPTSATRPADGRPGGAGGVTTFRFRAAAAGTASLAFAYRRPAEANIPPMKAVRFDIKVE